MEAIDLYDTVEILIDKTESGKTVTKGTLGVVLEMKKDENHRLFYLVEIDSMESLLFVFREEEIRKIQLEN